MNRGALLSVIIALSLAGLADSWYLFVNEVHDTALVCDLGAALSGCNIVAQSAYSYFLGFPLALYGVGFYAILFVLAAMLFVMPVRRVYQALLLLSAGGAAMSVVFILIQAFLIKALCIYCLASAGITFILFALAYSAYRRFAPPHLVRVLEPAA